MARKVLRGQMRTVSLGVLLVVAACVSGQYVFHEGVEWVKVVKAGKGESWDHPRRVPPEAMKNVLQSIRYSKKIVFLRDIEHASLLSEEVAGRFAPYLSQALLRAKPDQVVAVSILVKDPKLVVFRNDRLTTGRVFIKGDDLVISFDKLNAKLIGDYSNVGKEARTLHQAQTLRTALELGPGQKGSYHDPDTILFDLKYWEGGKAVPPVAASVAVTTADPQRKARTYELNPKARLKQLDQLRADELITEEEYQKKRAEILQGL